MEDLGRVFETVSRYFSLLSEPMRLRILHSICDGERTVSEIVAETGATQTNVSRHLNTMYRAGVLTRRKESTFTYYGVADLALTDICRTVCVHIAGRHMDGDAQQAGLAEFARELEAAGRRQAAIAGESAHGGAGPTAAGMGDGGADAAASQGSGDAGTPGPARGRARRADRGGI